MSKTFQNRRPLLRALSLLGSSQKTDNKAR